MYPYIVCLCGASLGDIYDAFKAMRAAKYESAGATVPADPALACLGENTTVDLRDVFEALGITPVCCRTHIATQVEFRDYY